MQLVGGDNEVIVSAEGAEDVALDLVASTGGNSILIGLQLVAVQKVRGGAALVSLDLGVGGNLIDVTTDGYEDVTLELNEAPAPTSEPSRFSPTAFSFTAGGANPSSPRSRTVYTITFGGSLSPTLGDPVTFTATILSDSHFVEARASIVTGDGPDSLTITTDNVERVDLEIDAGDGDDTIEVNTNSSRAAGRYRTLRPRPVEHRVDIDAGDGDDTVAVSNRVGPFFNVSSNRLHHNVALGDGDDRLTIDAAGFGGVTSLIDGGAGDDVVESRYVRHRFFAIVDRTQVNVSVRLGAGMDTLSLDTGGIGEIRVFVETGPAGDGPDDIRASHVLFPGARPATQLRGTLDDGRDVFDVSALGYTVTPPIVSAVTIEYLVLG
jgi:hypothetical protein